MLDGHGEHGHEQHEPHGHHDHAIPRATSVHATYMGMAGSAYGPSGHELIWPCQVSRSSGMCRS
jgi:hypothetical protein